MTALIDQALGALGLLRGHRGGPPGLRGDGRRRPREGEDAPLRQQERVPGARRPRRGDAPGGHAGDGPADEPGPRRGARGVGRPDLRGHRRALQLQRPRAALLPAPLAERRRPPGEPRRQARPEPAVPRPRQEGAPRPPGDRQEPRRPGQGRSRSHPALRCSTRWWPRSTARRPAPARAWPGRSAASSRPPPGSSTWTIRRKRPRDRVAVVLDREKAGLKGVPAAAAVETIARAGRGPRPRPPRRPRFPRAGPRPAAPLRRRPRRSGAPALAARRCARAERWPSASSPAPSGRRSPSPSCTRT